VLIIADLSVALNPDPFSKCQPVRMAGRESSLHFSATSS
jgi:hypothetical protein